VGQEGSVSIPRECDVAVIGGGPAGSLAACLLSQQGYDVVLFEKVKHPRFTVGESIIPHFWRYADAVGASAKIEAEDFIRKAGGTVVWNGVIRQMRFKDFGYERSALHVERDRLDYLLLEHARQHGAKIFENVSVVEVDLAREPVRVTYRPEGEALVGDVSCRFVVDASGQSAVIARQLGLRVVDDGFRFMSIWGYFLDSKYVAADGRAYAFEHVRSVPPTTFVSSVGGPMDWGWAWHIPLRKSTSVGLVLPLDELRRIKAARESYAAYFLRRCYEIPHLDRLLEHARYVEGDLHIIRDYSYRPTQLAGPGFFLTGDAAAFVDPIFSVGFVLALYSAYVAAWAIDRSLRNPRQTAHNQAIFSSQCWGRLEVARAVALPRYRVAGETSDLARLAVQFESSLERELMYVVSTVTTRSENFLELAQGRDGQPVSSDRYRVLEEIAF
jgi:flavin-dependent dehydrogenase